MRRITALILCVFIIAGSFSVCADDTYSIEILSTVIDGDSAAVSGKIVPAASVPLSFSVYNGDALCSEGDMQSDASGLFSFSFPVVTDGETRRSYRYVISEKGMPDSIREHYSDDFSERKSYIKYGAADGENGNPSPSVKIGDGGDNRLLYSTSRISSGIYSVSADIMIPSGINRLLFAVTNSEGNSGKNNGNINKMTDACSYSAFQLFADGAGNIKLEHAVSDSEQTSKNAAAIGTYTPGEWFSFKAEMNFDTLELNAFFNGEAVCEDDSMYIFAQQNYGRMFDTSYPSGGVYFIDNIKIDEITRTGKRGVPDYEGTFVCYGSQDYANALAAVNGASDAEEFSLALESYEDMFGIDYAAFSNMPDDAKQMIFNALDDEFLSIQKFTESYFGAYSAAAVLFADSGEFAEAVKANAAVLSFAPDEGFYTDNVTIGAALLSRENIRDLSRVKAMLENAIVMHKLRNADGAVLGDMEDSFAKYGCYAVYSKSSVAVKGELVSAAASYSFDGNRTVEENLMLWGEYMNKAFDAACASSAEYVTEITETVVSGQNISVSGRVSPAIKYDFVLTASYGGEIVAEKNFSTDENGEFSLDCTVPEHTDDRNYTFSVQPVHPAAQITTYLEDDFHDRSVSYVKDDVVISDTEGNSAPSAKIIKNAEFSRPRLLYRAGEVKSLISGIVHIQADIMKPDKMASSKLFSVTDDSGNYTALTLFAGGGGELGLKYRNEDNSDLNVTLIDDYETKKWYTVDYAIDMESKEVVVSVNGEECAAVTIGNSIPDFARVIDCEGGGDAANPAVHYVDNLKCYRDSAQRANISDKYCTVNVPGTIRLKEALDALNTAAADTILNVISRYNDVFDVNLAALDSVNDKAAVYSGITAAADSRYTSAAQVRSAFYAQIALVRLKEALPSERGDILYGNRTWLDADAGSDIINNALFSDLLGKNIASFTKYTQLKAFLKNLVLLTEIKSATQLFAYTVVDKYADTLKGFGLSDGYSAKSEAVRRSCAAAAIGAVSDSSDPEVLLKEAMEAVNSALAAADSNSGNNNNNRPGGSAGGGGGGGNSGGSSGGYTAPITADTVKNDEKLHFADVDKAHWAFEAVNYLADKGIVNGMGNGEFCPDLPVAREEFVKLIIACLNEEITSCEHTFGDVVSGSWYEKYVAFAYEKGIANGMSDGSFGVGLAVTRQDAAVMIYRCIDMLNAGISPSGKQGAFSDVSEISPYALEAVEYLYKCGVLTGTDGGRFAPTATLTRAEAAKLLYETVRR